MDIQEINKNLESATPQQIIQWAVDYGKQDTLVSTNFNPHEAGILKLVTNVMPNIPVLWVDLGYNTQATYKFALYLIEHLKLNIKLYVPKRSRAFLDVIYNGIPTLEDLENHTKFTQEVKLEPFQRGLQELKPKVWITALRKDQTDFRQNLKVVSSTQDGILKVCPILNWQEQQLEDYIQLQNLPIEKDYYDPTKVLEKRECGLHPKI